MPFPLVQLVFQIEFARGVENIKITESTRTITWSTNVLTVALISSQTLAWMEQMRWCLDLSPLA